MGPVPLAFILLTSARLAFRDIFRLAASCSLRLEERMKSEPKFKMSDGRLRPLALAADGLFVHSFIERASINTGCLSLSTRK